MTEICPSCGATVAEKHINRTRGLAVCPSCNRVYTLADGPLPPDASHDKRKSKRGEPANHKPEHIAPPTNITVNTRADGFIARRRHFTPAVIPLIFFTVFWDGFMVVWYTIAITQQQWEMALFGTIHGAVGVGLLYFVLSSLLNVTTIDASYSELRITTSPVYRHAPRLVTRDQLEQVYVKKDGNINNKPTFAIMASRYDDSPRVLLGGIAEYHEALYIERAIEDVMGITDVPVDGEYSLYRYNS